MATGAPWLICDPQEGATKYRITGPAWMPTELPAQGDGSLRLDLMEMLPGVHPFAVAACDANGCGPAINCTLYKTSGTGKTGISMTPTLKLEWWVKCP